MSYIPGKALILSRLPAQEWFSLDEVARYSGWGRSFVRDRIKDGTLQAQEFQRPADSRRGKRKHLTFRVHLDDLALFIIRHGNKFSEERPFRDVAMIINTWPRWMVQELRTHLDRTLTAKPSPSPSRTNDR